MLAANPGGGCYHSPGPAATPDGSSRTTTMNLLKNTPGIGRGRVATVLSALALCHTRRTGVVCGTSVRRIVQRDRRSRLPVTRVESIALQPDGKILIRRALHRGQRESARGGVARLHPEWLRSTPTFNHELHGVAYVGAIAVQQDGKILVGGTLPAIAGLAATGARSTEFRRLDRSRLQPSRRRIGPRRHRHCPTATSSWLAKFRQSTAPRPRLLLAISFG